MVELVKKPSEEIYEIEFSGHFIPEKFNPLWFATKKLLGKKEAQEAEIINIIQGTYCAFKTNFLEIYVESGRFRVLSKNLASHDLVNDMAISVSKLLKDSLYDIFYINLKLHYSFSSKDEFSKKLNNLLTYQDWSNIFENPQLVGFRVTDSKTNETYDEEKLLSIFPCERQDMEFTTHLYLKNRFIKKDQFISLSYLLEEKQDLIKTNIEFANKVIKRYF